MIWLGIEAAAKWLFVTLPVGVLLGLSWLILPPEYHRAWMAASPWLCGTGWHQPKVTDARLYTWRQRCTACGMTRICSTWCAGAWEKP